VPPHLLFELSDANYATSENLSLEFYKFTIRPKLKKIAAEITKKLLASGFCLEFDAKPLTAGDTAARTAFCVAGLQSGFLTPNEARAEFNLPPKPNGDTLKTPLNMGNAGGDPIASKSEPVNEKENTQ
jgi:HK97 family phage portal protein